MDKLVDICSISYNEEVLIEKWAQVWRSIPWIGNIDLVDGGSTDNTVSIAKKYGINVIIVPWQNDFARQRNIAIKLAKSEWFIMPDVDEIPCGNINTHISDLLTQNYNQIVFPYIKFYDKDRLWFFKDGNTPMVLDREVVFGNKSTITVFKKNHLIGYSKSLHEMPILSGQEKKYVLRYGSSLDHIHNTFMIAHLDQYKHFEQAKQNGTSVEYEMGLKRARYRLISDATYEGKVYNREWAEMALREKNKEMLEELGRAQLKEFMKQHIILKNYDASKLLVWK